MDLTAANSGMGNELVDHADNNNVTRVHIDEKEENVSNSSSTNSSSSSSIIITKANQLIINKFIICNKKPLPPNINEEKKYKRRKYISRKLYL